MLYELIIITKHCMTLFFLFSECANGTYGLGCNGTCGKCKDGAVCDKVTGNCDKCEPGWYQPLCQQGEWILISQVKRYLLTILTPSLP
jgi:hypothetical protein